MSTSSVQNPCETLIFHQVALTSRWALSLGTQVKYCPRAELTRLRQLVRSRLVSRGITGRRKSTVVGTQLGGSKGIALAIASRLIGSATAPTRAEAFFGGGWP
jgi:hypothetical protein